MAFFHWQFSETAGFEGYRSRFRGIRAPKARLRPAGLKCSDTPIQTACGAPWGPWSARTAVSGPGRPWVYTRFSPGDESLALKNRPTPVVAPAGKFPSRIRLLQFSTRKITTTREHSCQFGETSYSMFWFFGFCCLDAEPIWGSSLGPTRESLTPPSRPFVGPPFYWPSSCGFYEETVFAGTRPPNPTKG